MIAVPNVNNNNMKKRKKKRRRKWRKRSGRRGIEGEGRRGKEEGAREKFCWKLDFYEFLLKTFLMLVREII